jgi:hypothetical protein
VKLHPPTWVDTRGGGETLFCASRGGEEDPSPRRDVEGDMPCRGGHQKWGEGKGAPPSPSNERVAP